MSKPRPRRNRSARRTFADLLTPLIEPGFRLALAMLHDAQAAEDAVQEASFTAWRKVGRISDQGRLRSWFLGVVANKCRNARRRKWVADVKLGLPEQLSVVSDVVVGGGVRLDRPGWRRTVGRRATGSQTAEPSEEGTSDNLCSLLDCDAVHCVLTNNWPCGILAHEDHTLAREQIHRPNQNWTADVGLGIGEVVEVATPARARSATPVGIHMSFEAWPVSNTVI
jgi:hypothetical protein